MTARLQMVVARDPALLLAAAAPTPSPTAPYLLALRQGGLRDDVLARMAGGGPSAASEWAPAPLCVFDELPLWLGATSRHPCDDFERAVLLGGVLRRLGGEVFGRLHRPERLIGALGDLCGELCAEGVTPEAFQAALEGRTDRDAFERQRDFELTVIYRTYREALDRAGRRDGRDTWLDCAYAVAADPEALARRLRARRELRLVGLQDLRGGWRHLLGALCASPALDRIVVYTSEPLELAEFGAEVVTVAEPVTVATRLFGGVGPAGAAVANSTAVSAIAAPDTERELELVAVRVRALAESGVPLGRIAVVARQGRPYLPLAVDALERAGVPATARRRAMLAEIPVVRALCRLLTAAAGGWSRHGLVELAEQPYLASELDARVLNFAGLRRRLHGLAEWHRILGELALAAEGDEARRRDDPYADERRATLPPAARCREAVGKFERFAARAAELDGRRSLAEWVVWLETFLDEDPWGIRARIDGAPGQPLEIAALDYAGWAGVAAVVDRWRAALDHWGGAADQIGVAAFYEQLADLLAVEVALPAETAGGVQVLEGLAAAYRTFDHLFFVGLAADQCPLPPRRSPLFDEREQHALAALGLPFESRDAWEARERALFRVVVAGARHVTVSYARLDSAGREAVRSAFVDALADVAPLPGGGVGEAIPTSLVVIDGIRLYAGHAARASALHALQVERVRIEGGPSPYNGRIEDPALVAYLAREFGDDRVWSPTQLEAYAKCPWSYLSARLLRVTRAEEPDEEMDPATRGSLLHDALRRFYQEAHARLQAPVFLRTNDLAWARPLVAAALDEAMAAARDAVGAVAWLGNPRLLAAKREELRRTLERFLAWEAQEHEDMDNPRKRNAPRMVRTGVTTHELAFPDVVLERDGIRIRFRGTMDRVETGVDSRFAASRFVAAVDYKSSTGATPGGGSAQAWDDGVVLQVPLYAYAVSQVQPETELARIEYRALKQCEAVHSLDLYQFDRKSGSVVRNDEAAGRLEQALGHAAAHVRRARGGEFPAAPVPSCGCPPFCHAIEICRIPGGPRHTGRR